MSKPKRTVTPFMYMSPTLAFPHVEAFGKSRFAKVSNISGIKNKTSGNWQILVGLDAVFR